MADAEQGFVTRINQERQAAGLPAYAAMADLQAVARRHAQRMADRGQHYHNPNLGSEVSNWRIVGENVGRGGGVEGLHQAFMASPAHRANIMSNDLTQVGLGVVQTADGTLWVVQVFRQPMAPAAAPASNPAPAPAAPPAPVAPPTTVPPPPPTTVPPPAPTTTVPPSPTTTTVAPTATTHAPVDLVQARATTAAAITPALPVETPSIRAAAWLAALLLAAVVGFQTETLRRLGLLRTGA